MTMTRRKTIVNFVADRATKHTLRFREIDDSGIPKEEGAKVGTLYVQKSVFEGEYPPALQATLEY